MLFLIYPTSSRAPDAVYFIGESYATTNPDSTAVYYQRVVEESPGSPRVPTALYKLGLLAEGRGDAAAARAAYDRVVQEFPSSDASELARDRLSSLGQ